MRALPTLLASALLAACAAVPRPVPRATTALPGLGQPAPAAPVAAATPDAGGYAQDARHLALAQLELQKAQTYTGLSDAQLQSLRLAELAIARGEGRAAWQRLTALTRELAQKTKRYVVAAGDSLWVISGRDDIYGNPWLWPLIWKANLDTIEDPNRLLAGQRLKVRPNPTIDEVVAAVEYAHAAAARSVRIGEVKEAKP